MPRSFLLFSAAVLLIGIPQGLRYFSSDATATRNAWRVVCANAPHRAGSAIGAAEQRAMTQLDLWKFSVEEVNQACTKQH